MFTEPTVFVLGAGSSMELGLPSGQELASVIAEDTAFDFDGFRVTNGNPFLFEFCKQRRLKSSQEIFTNIVITGRQISTGLPLAASIDNFIATHIQNTGYVELSKAAIVINILKAEQESKLYFDTSNTYNFWDHSDVNSTWLIHFFHKLVENVKKDDINNIFKNVYFINFNYDRCVEHFLTNALARYFKIDPNETLELVKNLWMKRPYGEVATYDPSSSYGLAFGNVHKGRVVEKYFDNIKTFSEEDHNMDTIHEIRAILKIAKKIIFLGLAFHDPNIEFFSLGTALEPLKRSADTEPDIYATAFGQSKVSANVIAKTLFSRLLRFRLDNQFTMSKSHEELIKSHIHIREDLKCSALLDQYQKSI